MALLDKLFTVKEAAELLHLSDSHVRQICIRSSLGVKAGRDRFLSSEDIDAIREKQKPVGRPKKNSNDSDLVA
ncbi:MAG: helix-turn-helix domain-containing protein [Planctomycetes bacterium]|nr:helix-turn-helix domain-containing protein [Planctomycetota bacterium]